MIGLNAHGPGAVLQRPQDHRRAGGRRRSGGALAMALVLALAGWVVGATLTHSHDGPATALGPFSYFPS